MPGILRSQPSMVDQYNAMQPGALSPIELAIYKSVLPMYDSMSKKSRRPGILTDEDAAWDAMVERFKNYTGRPASLDQINGAVVPNPAPSSLPLGWIGVRG